MRENLLKRIARVAEKRAGTMLLIALIFTFIAAGLASNLELTMHFKNLMPQSHLMVKEFNQVIDDYSTASMIIIAAKGQEGDLKEFADEIAGKVASLDKYVKRVDYKIERNFILEHGLKLQKEKDLKNSQDLYKNLGLLPWLRHLNENFEKTWVQDEASISTKEKENNAVMFLDGIKYWLQTLDQYTEMNSSPDTRLAQFAAERLIIGDEYMISPDKDMILLFAQPTFTINEMDKVIKVENTIDALIADVAAKYPGLFAGTTGMFALARDETVAASEDMYITSLLALVLILALFIISFRMWVAPILAGISLTIGIIWAAGFAAITVGSLNIMTSMFSVILIGLGVDFSIHIISVYTEKRAEGNTIGAALELALIKSGSGIITGGFTTAFAFLTLMISESAGMSEFGIVAGSGVIFCMLAAILVLPAMLSFRDRILTKLHKKKFIVRSPEFKILGSLGENISKQPVTVLLACLLVTALLFYSALQITFDYNYLNMEPIGLTSIKLQHEMENKFDVTPDFAIVTAESIEKAREITKSAKDLKMIGMVTSISEYIPSTEEQNKRLPIIHEIRKSLRKNQTIIPLSQSDFDAYIDELYRVEDNIIELAQLAFLGGQDKVDKKCKEIIGDLESENNESLVANLVQKIKADPVRNVAKLNSFNTHFAPHFRKLALGMATTTPITIDDIPEDIKDRFVSHDGKKFLVTIYPKEQVWNLEFLERFTQQMQKLDPRVTGVAPIFYILIDIIAQDGKKAAALTIVVVFVILLLDFRKIHYAILAMIPLIIGAIWMLGTMHLFGLQLTMVNLMGLPLIIGIGIDDGVHILHRYRVEGAGKIRTVFSSTGKAVLLTSLTTMLAFGSLVFATYRGLGSLGIALFIGVGACFLSSIIILPALLGLIEKNNVRANN
ncbi:MAG: multidrug RND transporter [Calditrichaeota bacterium]|nr:MAG: multidrug RND transporter [Calditrichota bacterium]